MRFVSSPLDRKALPKIFSFDSSPGYAISRVCGDLDVRSYTAILLEEKAGERLFEIRMRRRSTEINPGPHPLLKVGTLHWSKPRF
jgi:hypothetical protein